MARELKGLSKLIKSKKITKPEAILQALRHEDGEDTSYACIARGLAVAETLVGHYARRVGMRSRRGFSSHNKPAKRIARVAETGLVHVYFLREEESGPIKIGMAVDVEARISQLQGGNHRKLTLVGLIMNATPDAERRIHKSFKHHRIRGEWFHPGEDLLQFINELTLNNCYTNSPSLGEFGNIGKID